VKTLRKEVGSQVADRVGKNALQVAAAEAVAHPENLDAIVNRLKLMPRQGMHPALKILIAVPVGFVALTFLVVVIAIASPDPSPSS
jgi:hypothetical protein